MRSLFLLIGILSILSCNQDKKETEAQNKVSNKLFSKLDLKDTKVSFTNSIQEDPEINFYKYQYLYNGGGVGIGDINNDGLPDIYFTSTQGEDKLYLNKGNFVFEDISKKAGISKYSGYKTGVNLTDINNDGWTDIYVCRSGWSNNESERENLLFINQKDNTFKEEAKNYGLNDSNRSIHSTFFDYDKDGDLDVFIANHPKGFNLPMVEVIENIKNPQLSNSHKLFKNDNNKFIDVTVSSGILNYGYGLGTSVSDFNNDGWLDIYVTSDFSPRDLYYLNNGDGTFKESLEDYFPHASYFAMGVDATDINNDGAMDIFVGEMLAEDNKRQKTNMAPMDLKRFSILASNGMYFQYMRNSFFINNGGGHFADVAHYSGIDKTDWSWSVLFGDYDLDGDEDLLVANGWLKDTQDKDFSKISSKIAEKKGNKLSFKDISPLLKSTPLQNYAFEYKGDLEFKKVSKEWGFDEKGFSHGMATGDLDNDGDLDVVINNINSPASIYKNNANKNYLKIKLMGYDKNPFGLNTSVTVYSNGLRQTKELQNSRGFQSSNDRFLHFGLKNASVDSILLNWPNNTIQKVSNPEINKLITIEYQDDKRPTHKNKSKSLVKSYPPIDSKNMTHKEKYFDDYKIQVLLPHMFSQLGPTVSKGDFDNNGLEDIFIGSSSGLKSSILLQKKSGNFEESNINLLESDKAYEDVESHVFDANNDGHLDIIVGSGSSEFISNPKLCFDRLYVNDGKGVFTKDNSFPQIPTITGSISSADIDGDGDKELFIGSRLVPGQYPTSPRAIILDNDSGKFTIANDRYGFSNNQIGMVNSSAWFDVDEDGDLDLIYAGEWTGIQCLKNKGGKLSNEALSTNIDKKGWWNTIHIADLNNDGREDILLGNLGRNYKYQASENEPFEIYGGDFDSNGQADIVLGYYQNNELYPVRGLQCSSEQMPSLKSKFDTYDKFGDADLFQVYGNQLKSALHLQANSFESCILWNNGKGNYSYETLPFKTQLSPIQKFETLDFDKDGDLDIIAAGNWFVAEIETPRADSGQGIILENLGGKKFKTLHYNETGFLAKNDVRDMILLKNHQNKDVLIVANNNNRLESFIFNNQSK